MQNGHSLEEVEIVKVVGLVLSVFLLSAGPAGPARAQTIPVPFVGCASDGQMGPKPAPTTAKAPRLPAETAARLAWYASDDLGVLAPRGWKCQGLYGSNGAILLVLPNAKSGSKPDRISEIKGEGIQLSVSDAETSGRFEAARIAALLFPNRKAFVDEVANEGIVPKEEFEGVPLPHDRMRRIGSDQVVFETPGDQDGLGTMSRLVKSHDPIQGKATMDQDNDATMLLVRLNPDLRDLAPAILGAGLP
jgi:hypothetical protein